ncbi:MAG: hypothetical protein IKO73_01640 [Bacteroidaceae bacterium]|nr:hypothetical protein [Bacteroidaceae bacterium]
MTTTTCTLNEISAKKSVRASLLQSNAVLRMARFFSKVSGEKVSPRRALHMLNAQLSFVGVILFGGFSLIVGALTVSWFALSVYQCSKMK